MRKKIAFDKTLKRKLPFTLKHDNERVKSVMDMMIPFIFHLLKNEETFYLFSVAKVYALVICGERKSGQEQK